MSAGNMSALEEGDDAVVKAANAYSEAAWRYLTVRATEELELLFALRAAVAGVKEGS